MSREPYTVFNIPTVKKALKAFVADGRVYVVVNESIPRVSETYMISFSIEDLIMLKLNQLYDAGCGE